jgi:plastocyanin
MPSIWTKRSPPNEGPSSTRPETAPSPSHPIALKSADGRMGRNLFRERSAITRLQGIIAVVVIVVAVGAGGYFLSMGGSGSGPIDLSIVESDPVNQVDAFNPANITMTHGATVTLAIQNGDDEPRTFQIAAFNVNQTIASGATNRITFTVGPPGVYTMYLPPEPPYAGFRASPAVTGYVIVS